MEILLLFFSFSSRNFFFLFFLCFCRKVFENYFFSFRFFLWISTCHWNYLKNSVKEASMNSDVSIGPNGRDTQWKGNEWTRTEWRECESFEFCLIHIYSIVLLLITSHSFIHFSVTSTYWATETEMFTQWLDHLWMEFWKEIYTHTRTHKQSHKKKKKKELRRRRRNRFCPLQS